MIHARRALLRSCVFVLVVCAMNARAAITGPTYPPPGGVIFSDTGDNGTGQQISSSRQFIYQNLMMSNFRSLYWAPDPSQLWLWLNGATGTNLTFDATSSNLPGGVAVWLGSSPYPYLTRTCFTNFTGFCNPASTSTTYNVRFTVTVTTLAGSPLAMTTASSVGVSGPGAVLPINQFNNSFRATISGQANNGSWVSAQSVYNISGSNGPQFTGNLRSSFFGMFWYDPNAAPVANDQSISTNEDAVHFFTADASDTDGDNLNLQILSAPSKGSVGGSIPNLFYNPHPNANGSDSFTYRVTDPFGAQDTATVSVTINPLNDAPVANAQSVTLTEEDPATNITLAGSDVDGNSLSYSVESNPTKGVLGGTAPNLTYTPNANAFGADSFTFSVNDGSVNSNIATVSITINGVSDPPTADAQLVTLDEDTPTPITLTGTDPDGDSLTFAIATPPDHGDLSGTAPDVTYTPDENYFGADSFTFTVNDGTTTSAAATVSVTVFAVNDTPTANPQSVTTNEDVALDITLVGTDVDGDTLTYTIVTPPTTGTTGQSAANIHYQPNANANGADSFTFTVNDGGETSLPATVSITITPQNDAPSATEQSVTTDEDTPKAITLAGTDVDGHSLTFNIVASPANGDLSGMPPNVTYTADPNYHGGDSFTFTVNDGTVASAAATVSITVTPQNDAPSATPQSVTTDEDTPKPITLAGTDPDGEPLTFSIVDSPANGDLSGTPPNVTYTPDANTTGSDSFTFTANDGTVTSSAATVSITITPQNDAPSATPQSVTTDEDTPKSITLAGTDPDGDTLTFSIVDSPTNGDLSGTPPNVTYTPDADSNGNDSFTFTVNDGTATSSAATVSMTITPQNDAPIANSQSVTTSEGAPLSITLTGSDVDADPLTFVVATEPTKGVLTGTAPALTYTPNATESGTDSFTFTVNDGTVTSSAATVSITITPVGPPGQTAIAPYLVRNINASGHSSPAQITATPDGRAIFRADEPIGGAEPWVSDGTTGGTQRLDDLEPNSASSSPAGFTTVNTLTFFSATTSGAGTELWTTTGTLAGTGLLEDINGSGGSNPSSLTKSNGALFFAADDGAHGLELWTSNGTEAGTVMVSDPNPGSSSPAELIDLDGTLYYAATDPNFGRELWSSDGASTTMVRDIATLTASSSPRNLSNVAGELYFTADGTSSDELWTSDGTSGGTVRVKDINAAGGDGVSVVVSGYFAANDGSSGAELWKTNGTEGGTTLVKDIHAGAGSGVPSFTTANALMIGGTLLFAADDGMSGVELWKSDGSEGGTQRVKDICAGACSSNPTSFVAAGGKLYFRASNPYVGDELWVSDGTSAGTLVAGDLEPGSGGSSPQSLAAIGNLLYFAANTTATGNELHALCTTSTTHLGITGPSSSISAATASLQVRPLDGANALVPCYTGTVHFTSNDPNATLPADHTFAQGEGAYAFDVTLRSLGSHTVTATDTVTGAIVGTIDITVGASPVTSTITAAPASIVANGASTSTITVQYKDADGVNLTTGGGALALSTTAGALSTPVNHNDGTYTATLTSSTALEEATISGTIDGVAITDTATVAFVAGNAASFVVTAPANAPAGTPFNVTITARDANSHIATGYTGTIHFTSSDGSATLPGDYTFVPADNGVRTFTNGVTLQTAGSRSVVATDTVTASVTGSANVIVGATATIVTSSPNPSAPGTSVTLQATVTPTPPGTPTGDVTFKDGSTTLGTASLTGGTASLNTSALTSGPHTITAIYNGDANYGASTSPPHTHTVTLVAPIIAATATATNSVTISWSALSGAVGYDVFRSTNNGAYSLIGQPASANFIDGTVSANTSYLYKVRGRDAAANLGPLSAPDPATTVLFTNDPLAAGVTVIRATHLTEVRTAVNALRAFAGLSAATFTDPAITTATRLKAVHISELRTALNAARTALSLGAIAFTDPTLTVGATKAKAAHVMELRDGVR